MKSQNNKNYRKGQANTYKELHTSEHYKKYLESRSADYKEYRNKWEQASSHYMDYGYPINLDIEIAGVCNLKCPMCPLTVKGGKDRFGKHLQFFPYELFCRIIDEASEIGVCSVKLTWMGEPLMHPKIVDMVKYAKSKDIIDVSFNTNATLLNEKLSQKLLETDIDGIFFSFDTSDKETYEKIRVGAKFEDVVKNIQRFCEMRNQTGKLNPITRISSLVFPDKEEEFSQIVEMFKDTVDIISRLTPLDMAKNYSYLKEHKADIQFSCNAPWQRMVISVDGRTTFCCFDTACNCLATKNINDTTIKELWNSPQAKEFRKLHQESRWYDNKQCSECCLVAHSSGF
ncbi:MAG: radical SAM protein [Defluviitaleaceae bacterium]|nr:radical SAM protein [Defluviitaleaceae bacterium]